MTADAVDTLDHLQHFVEDRGWKVFPCFGVRDGACICGKPDCTAPGKHPMTFNGVKAATGDPRTIIEWFNYMPGCNWAVATGEPSGIWVLDIDVHDDDGVHSLKSWLMERGIELPETYTVHTGGGGWHYYFSAKAAALRNRGRVLPGVDVRAGGGYVMLPGSSHISGVEYTAVRDAPIVHAPTPLVDYLRSAGSASIPSGSNGQRRSGGSGKLLDYYLEHGFTPSSRDVECYIFACSLWRKHFNDPDLVEAIIADCWRATSQEGSPFPWSQAKHKLRVAHEFIKKDVDAEAAFLRQHGGAL